MAQKFLNRPQIGSSIKQMRGVGMAQCVGVCGVHRTLVENPPDIAGAESVAVRIQEQRNARSLAHYLGPRLQPITHRLDGRQRHRYSPLFTALTPNGDDTSLDINAVNVKIAELTHAQATSVQHF
jgi:hypothetical protein